MAINPISSADAAKMVAQVTATNESKPAQAAPAEKKAPEPKPQPVADTVNISSKAKEALEEIRETQAEAAKEAGPSGREK